MLLSPPILTGMGCRSSISAPLITMWIRCCSSSPAVPPTPQEMGYCSSPQRSSQSHRNGMSQQLRQSSHVHEAKVLRQPFQCSSQSHGNGVSQQFMGQEAGCSMDPIWPCPLLRKVGQGSAPPLPWEPPTRGESLKCRSSPPQRLAQVPRALLSCG